MWAMVYLFAAWPVVLAMFFATERIGQLILGSEFHIDSHAEIKLIHAYKDHAVQLAIFINTALLGR